MQVLIAYLHLKTNFAGNRPPDKNPSGQKS